MKNAYIIDYIRTPIANFQGSLSTIRADDLGAMVLKSLIERNPSITSNTVEDVIMGCANQAGEDNRNIARMSSLLAGISHKAGAETINRLCASGMASVANAYRAIAVNEGSVYIAGGVEHMTRAPFVMSKASSAFGRDSQMHDSSFGWRFINPKMKEMYGVDGMGETAENLAEMYQISREDQDAFALHSQQKAFLAQQSGRLAKEIIPVSIPKKKGEDVLFSQDEFIKGKSTLETLSKLRPAFKKIGGTVTAGNASGLNDGAAALLIVNEDLMREKNLTPIAKIISAAVSGVEPRIMGIGPVEASKKALARAGLSIEQIDVIELNEAFAAQSIACIRELGLQDKDPRINPNGGAIALGHPLGMSGARIVGSAALELQLQNKQYALCTMCIGVGQGYAVIIENPNYKQ